MSANHITDESSIKTKPTIQQMDLFTDYEQLKKEEEKLEKELKDCMHCRFFWGHNNRCANGTCCKPSKKKEQKLPTECVGCPYYRGNGYCFPCMRKLIGK